MKVNIIKVTFNRKTGEKISKEIIGEREVPDSYEDQFIEFLIDKLESNGILGTNKPQLK